MTNNFENIGKCYDESPFKNEFDFFEIDSLKIPFKKDCNRILLWVSGGADSALLTYLMSEYISKNNLDVDIHVLQFARKWIKAPWQETIGKGVYNYFVRKYPNINYIRHSVMLPVCVEDAILVSKHTGEKIDSKSGDNLVSDEHCYYISAKYFIDINYNATTSNPPFTIERRVKSRDLICNGTKQDSYRLIGTVLPYKGYNCNPFIYVDKSWVIKQYKNNNLIDLLNITRSCESYIKNIDYTNWDGNVDTLQDCNTECYWCEERNWALKQNDLLQYKDKYGKLRCT